MKKILNILFEYKSLSYAQAKEVMTGIGHGAYNDAELASFMTVFLMRTITIDELKGFRNALQEMALPLYFDGELIDIVGTGGDGKNTFNISTAAAFVTAGTGNKVAKHGNYASTSITGSSNLMEAAGYSFKTDTAALQKELAQANITFLHAPLFHPALKKVSTVRKQLSVRTLFNMLGPLVNPARPAFQLLGVYNAELARMYNYLLQEDGKKFTIVHSFDGYDEISLTADVKVINEKSEATRTPYELGKRAVTAEDISGGASAEDALKTFIKILKGGGSWAQNAVVLANAAMALHTTGRYSDYDTCFSAAVESLESGKAYQSFKKLIG